MTKRYLLAKIKPVDSEIPDGHHTTTYTEYVPTYTGYNLPFDTLEEAEKALEKEMDTHEAWTILTVYVKD